MTLFYHYIAVDWSAKNKPATGQDSIWIGHARREGADAVLSPSRNPSTRSKAMQVLAGTLRDALAAGERVLLGFDFPFGYPKGAAKLVAGNSCWRDLWRAFGSGISDDDCNRSNRFDFASDFNRRHGPLYWGHPQGRSYPCLQPRKTGVSYASIPERRLIEERVTSAKSVWQLNGNGAVGGQALLGMARLDRLLREPDLAERMQVWPFETRFDRDITKPIVVAEIYPSIFPLLDPAVTPKDRAQVETVARTFATLDADGALGALLRAPDDLPEADLDAILAEEGWIVGGGGWDAVSLRRNGSAYLRDPEAIYRESFAAIQREVDLSHLSPPEREVAIRLIHACGMPEIVEDLVISDRAVEAGRAALGAGAPVICDANMVRAGIIASRLPAKNALICVLDQRVAPRGDTRSAAGMEALKEIIPGSVVAIGNAPTALFRLLELLEAGVPPPALVLGFPVGFVGAAESKAALISNPHGAQFIALKGRRGGSALAAAAVNALAGGLA